MDPNAAWQRFVDAVVDQDWDEARAAIEDLHDWCVKMGAPPKALSDSRAIHRLHGLINGPEAPEFDLGPLRPVHTLDLDDSSAAHAIQSAMDNLYWNFQFRLARGEEDDAMTSLRNIAVQCTSGSPAPNDQPQAFPARLLQLIQRIDLPQDTHIE